MNLEIQTLRPHPKRLRTETLEVGHLCFNECSRGILLPKVIVANDSGEGKSSSYVWEIYKKHSGTDSSNDHGLVGKRENDLPLS